MCCYATLHCCTYRYQEALDLALATRNPATVASVLDELVQRRYITPDTSCVIMLDGLTLASTLICVMTAATVS
jgi:hypothetical protein